MNDQEERTNGNKESRYKTSFAVLRVVSGRTLSAVADAVRTSPFTVPAIMLLTVLTGLAPIANLWVSRFLLDAIVDYLTTPNQEAAYIHLLSILGLQLSLGIATIFFTQSSSFLSIRLSRLVQFNMHDQIYQQCVSFDYEFFETPKHQDRVYRAQGQSSNASNQLFTTTMAIARKLITIFSATLMLFMFSPILCVLAVLIAVPKIILDGRLAFESYDLVRRRSERDRKTHYIAGLLVGRTAARDNLLFRTAHYFLDIWRRLARLSMTEDLALEFRRSRVTLLINLISSLAHVGAYYYVIRLTAVRSGSVGIVAMNVGLFANAQGQLQDLASDLTKLYQAAIFLDDYYYMRKIDSKIEVQTSKAAIDHPIRSIRFENVSFTYPNSSISVLKNVSFEIEAGQCVNLVGCNGAGKSTVVKLLLRLYDPESGRILINGRDLREFSIDSLRQTFAVLMQDFSMYMLSLRENIIVGDLAKMHDQEALHQAIRGADLASKVKAFPRGVDTIVGKIFGDGEDLSIGEWQRLGLARILFRDTPVYVLDEPTSALDAKMEESILRHFSRKTRGKISIIVSHRLSSARFADKIIVLDSGAVAECGVHDDLVAIGGVYAKLFQIQQRRYMGIEPSGEEPSLVLNE